MHTVTIPKRSGGTRTIYVPNRSEKAALRSIAGDLIAKARKADRAEVVHGFARGRSPVTNAQAHVGHAFTISFDLADFFASVTPERLVGKLSKAELEMVMVDGAARQGLPTSPAVANLAASDLDKAILRWIERGAKQVVYTRYADDLTLSFDDPALISALRDAVPQIVRRCGFALNPRKVRVQAAAAGRRIVCGVAVDDVGVHPTRAARRRLRAAQHQGHSAQAEGLAEWCKLRPPRERRRVSAVTLDEMEAVCRAWRLTVPTWYRKLELSPAIPDADLGDGCVITNDPVTTLGMSTWTSGWKSCMAQPHGQYRRGVWVWAGLPGTAIAAKLSDHTMTVAGVTRPRMAARALVHQLRDGRRVFDRLYGGTEAMADLQRQLRAAGWISIADARTLGGPDGRVIGNVPTTARPWSDNLRVKSVKLRSGRRALTLGLP
ncbi:MAG: reverse transcriptase family protein [Acidimicrobiales bacterium]